MQTFMNDFLIFFQTIFGALESTWTWLSSTILGEILIFIAIITIFIFVIRKIVSLKD